MFCMLKKEIYPASPSKHDLNPEKQVILLVILNKKRMVLSCIKKIINIVKRNNVKIQR